MNTLPYGIEMKGAVSKLEEGLKIMRLLMEGDLEAGLFAYLVIAEDYDTARERIELPGKILALLSPRRDEFLKKLGITVDFPDLIRFEFNKENVRKVLEVAKKHPLRSHRGEILYGKPEIVGR